MHKMYKFHSYQVNSHKAMVDAMKVKRSIYFATLQGYVIFETELYIAERVILNKNLYFILSSEINVYQKWIKVIFSLQN